jgi:hypothetical protein
MHKGCAAYVRLRAGSAKYTAKSLDRRSGLPEGGTPNKEHRHYPHIGIQKSPKNRLKHANAA